MNSIIQKGPSLFRFVELLKNKSFDSQGAFHQAKRIVADIIGVAYGGVQTAAFQSAVKSKNELFGEGKMPIWGTNESTDLSGSVFYNTLAVSATDFDEGHRKAAGHPASLVVPVAIMLGEHLGKSFTDSLKAIIVGYEAGTRFSYARYPEKVDTYSTGRWGAIATATAAAYLLGLNTEQFMHALSLAFVLSPGMQGGSTDVSTGSMSKEGVAWAAQSGLQSALLAQKGFTGPYLFIDSYDDIDVEKLLADESGDWLINSNYFKPFACCRWLHTAINLALELKSEHKILTESIKSIEVSIFSRAIDLIDSTYPENTVQAQFHLPFTMACALLFDKVTPTEICEANLSSNLIHQLIDKIKLVTDDEFTKTFPGKLGSEVTCRLKNGAHCSKAATDAPWDATNPPSDEELFRKFESLVGENAESLWNKYMHSE